MKLKLLIGALRFKVAALDADYKHTNSKNGDRYYVIPHPSKKGKLLSICKDDIKLWKEKKILNKNIDHLWIMKNCLYFTDADGKDVGKMKKERYEEKQQRWLDHLEKKKGAK